MKTLSKLFLSLCLVMGLGAALAAQAQIESDMTIEANIPHAFIVRDTTLPAGKYTIKVANAYDNLNLLEIRSANGRTAVFFETEDIQANRAPGKSELVFDTIGDNYFLSQVFLKGYNSGNQLAKSRMQQKLEVASQVRKNFVACARSTSNGQISRPKRAPSAQADGNSKRQVRRLARHNLKVVASGGTVV